METFLITFQAQIDFLVAMVLLPVAAVMAFLTAWWWHLLSFALLTLSTLFLGVICWRLSRCAVCSVVRFACYIAGTATSFLDYVRLSLISLLDPNVRLVKTEPQPSSELKPSTVLSPPKDCLGESKADRPEMAVPGSVMRYTTETKGTLIFLVEDKPVGMGSRVTFGGADMLVTAAHVYDGLPEVFEVTSPSSKVAITVEKSSLGVLLDATAEDLVGLDMPSRVYTSLGVAKLHTTEPRQAAAGVYTPAQGGGAAWAHNILTNSGSMQLEYSASTLPGSSGAPIIQGGKVVGVHLGARPSKGKNYGVALPHFMLRSNSQVLESAERTSLVVISPSLPDTATPVEFGFRKATTDLFTIKRFKTLDGRLSWADQVDDELEQEKPTKADWLESDFLKPLQKSSLPQEATCSGASEPKLCDPSVMELIKEMQVRLESSEDKFSKLLESLLAKNALDLQPLTKLKASSPLSQTGTSQSKQQKQKSEASDTKKPVPSAQKPPKQG